MEEKRSAEPQSSGGPSVSDDALVKDEDFSSAIEEAPTEQVTETEQLQARVAELEDRLLRVSADYDNYRKRMTRQFDEQVKAASDRMITELLEIIDNFERALRHTDEGNDLAAIRKGTDMVYNQFLAFLQKREITLIEALGQPFDPQLHEAVMQVDSDEYADGIVAMEMSRGYQQGSRVIRHARVAVSRGPAGKHARSKDKT